MPHLGLSDRICNIDSKSFWSSLATSRARGGAEGKAKLQKTLALGKQGKHAQAWQSLADYHRLVHADRIATLRGQLAAQTQIKREAIADILQNRIFGWHRTQVDFGKEIDWHTEAFGGSGLCGFHYLGWMAPVIQRLGQTNDEAARDWLAHTIAHYYKHRNDGDGKGSVNLHPTYYELGAGAKSRLLTRAWLVLLADGKPIPTPTIEGIQKLMLGFGRSLLHWQRKGYRSGNWQINGCGALIDLSAIYPEFRETNAWGTTGGDLLIEHVKRDFFADGGHKERCWSYGSGVITHLKQALESAEASGAMEKAQLNKMRSGVRKAVRWFASSIGPGGMTPSYGDAHLGHTNLRSMAAGLFPEDQADDCGVDRTRSCYLKPSGYAIMRNGDGPDSIYANSSLGPFWGWHSHQDTLSTNLWAYNTPLLEETGRFGGYDEPTTLTYRAAQAHNLCTVDGMPWDREDGARRTASDVHWYSDDRIDYLSGCHTAYRYRGIDAQQIDGVVRRTMLMVKDPGYMIVLDTVHAENSALPTFSLTQHWHSPFAFQSKATGEARTKGSPGCMLKWARPETLRHQSLETVYDASESKVATYPERHALRMQGWRELGVPGAMGFVTLLLPFKGKTPVATIRTLDAAGADPFVREVIEVVTPAGKDIIALNPRREAGLSWKDRKLPMRSWVNLAGRRGEVTID